MARNMKQELDVTVDIDELIKETPKAYLFRIGTKEFWMPKSQCEYESGSTSFRCNEWIATEKELI